MALALLQVNVQAKEDQQVVIVLQGKFLQSYFLCQREMGLGGWWVVDKKALLISISQKIYIMIGNTAGTLSKDVCCVKHSIGQVGLKYSRVNLYTPSPSLQKQILTLRIQIPHIPSM